ncbi:MAG: hypothetical protein AAF351_13490 [Pseudomonadota bacterium]
MYGATDPETGAIVNLHLLDSSGAELSVTRSGASDVMKWAVGWLPDKDVVVVWSSDIGVLAYSVESDQLVIVEQIDGAILARAHELYDSKYHIDPSIAEIAKLLQTKGQAHYFPEHAEYVVFPRVCNTHTCFHLTSVSYTSETNKGMIRLAVFDWTWSYLGCYSGLEHPPIGVRGDMVLFPESDFGSTAKLEGRDPPSSIWIDGYVIRFDPVET